MEGLEFEADLSFILWKIGTERIETGQKRGKPGKTGFLSFQISIRRLEKKKENAPSESFYLRTESITLISLRKV